jgi:hypothetical protein
MTISAESSLGGGGLAPVFFFSQGFGGSGFFVFSSFGSPPFVSLVDFVVTLTGFGRDGAELVELKKASERFVNYKLLSR